MSSFSNHDDDDDDDDDDRLYIDDEVIIKAQSIYDACKQIKFDNDYKNNDDINDNDDDSDVFTNHVEHVLNKLNERVLNIHDNSLKQSEVI